MISDKQLEVLVRNIDDTLAKTIANYQITPLSLSAVILARLILLNNQSDDIFQLCSEIGTKSFTEKTEVVH